jgi:hypothetical protein
MVAPVCPRPTDRGGRPDGLRRGPRRGPLAARPGQPPVLRLIDRCPIPPAPGRSGRGRPVVRPIGQGSGHAAGDVAGLAPRLARRARAGPASNGIAGSLAMPASRACERVGPDKAHLGKPREPPCISRVRAGWTEDSSSPWSSPSGSHDIRSRGPPPACPWRIAAPVPAPSIGPMPAVAPPG